MSGDGGARAPARGRRGLVADLNAALRRTTGVGEISGAGCLLLDASYRLRGVASTSSGARALSLAEELCGEGPCHDALLGQGTEVSDAAAEGRWPRLGVLLQASRLRSVISLPVHVQDVAVGVVFAYTSEQTDWSRAAYAALRGAAEAVERRVEEGLASPVESSRHPALRALRSALDQVPLLDEAAAYLVWGDARAEAQEDRVARLRRLSTATGLSPVELAHRLLSERRRASPAELIAHAAQRHADREELAQLALTDPLTGLANRVLFLDRLELAVARGERTEAYPAVLYLDIDRFKLINDSLGHDAGDQVLMAIADRLRTAIRSQDTACRLGGDEFAVLCEATDDPGEAHQVGRRIAEAIAEPLELRLHRSGTRTLPVNVQASVGVTVARAGQAASDVLRDADHAMYQAKRGTGPRVRIATGTAEDTAARQLRLESGLRDRFTTRSRTEPLADLHLEYQPILDLDSGRIVAVEALLRWQHPELGAVDPEELVAAAERTGVIAQLGAAVLLTACDATRPWAGGGAGIDLCVNVSALQFAEEGFLEVVDEAVAGGGFPAEHLSLELTETHLMETAGVGRAVLAALGGSGVKLAIDDFGTGYSSLAYLSQLPVHRLKIDRAFVAALDEAAGRTVVQAVIGLAEALGLQTVGEGIETDAQARELSSLRCELAQGYLYSRPQPLERLAAALDRGTLTPR